MNSFFKTVNSMTSKRQILVKESLQKQLTTAVMEMQSAPGNTDSGMVGNCEEAITLCSVLEAVFLHGLKDTLLNRVTEVITGPDVDAMPQPSFWGPLMVFSHRQIIDQIQNLSQITTEVGYCRAWIRLILNQELLASYLNSIRQDSSGLKPYYDRSAFIRDPDLVEIAQRLVENLEQVRFDLACNSSLLNSWSTTPLIISGIWSPPMKSYPVFSAVDIAKTINANTTGNDNFEEVETASSIGSLSSFNSSQSHLNTVGALSEDEALKIILANKSSDRTEVPQFQNEMKNIEESTSTDPQDNIDTSSDDNIINYGDENPTETNKNSDNVLKTESSDEPSTTVGNSLIGRRIGWSTSVEDGGPPMTTSVTSHTSDPPQTPGDGATYDALIQSYHTAGSNVSTIPDLKELLNKYPKKEVEKVEEEATSCLTNSTGVINFDDHVSKIARETGLDTQNYSCFECGHPIGMTFSKAFVCVFTGNYYCSKCMAQGEYIIPSRMIHNWDLNRYPVSQSASKYLNEGSALIDLKITNPKIYMAVDIMAQLQSLRIQLNLLRAYLYTCREPIIESLQKKVAPRDYLYEHVHQYSITDLLDIPNGILAQQLQKVVQFAKKHVLNCWLCSQKGFICEVCNNPKVIYPFDMDSTFRCGACNAVFHANCLNNSKPCPKCERRRKRMDLPLLDMECADLPKEIASSSPIDIN